MKKMLLSFLLMFSTLAYAGGNKIVFAGTTWCPACKFAKPILKEFVKQNPEVAVKIYNLDLLKKKQLKSILDKYEVGNYIPKYFFIIDGKKVARIGSALNLKTLTCLFSKFKNSEYNPEAPANTNCGVTKDLIRLY